MSTNGFESWVLHVHMFFTQTVPTSLLAFFHALFSFFSLPSFPSFSLLSFSLPSFSLSAWLPAFLMRANTETKSTPAPKAALCFIVSYEHQLHHEKLWREWIEPNRDILNIYVHYKDARAITSPWLRSYAIPPQFVSKTSYYNVVPAYMAVLSFAFNHDTQNQWFCMLTDTCVPIITPAQFRSRFLALHSKSIVRCFRAHWNLVLHQRANLRLLKPEYWLGNDPWFTLCRKHVHQCMIFMAMKNSIYNIVNAGGLANESLFAIVLQTFHEYGNASRHINLSSTLCDWERMSSPTSPYYFSFPPKETIMGGAPNPLWKTLPETRNADPSAIDQQHLATDVQRIKTLLNNPDNALCMFMRKVHVSFPDEKIKEIMQFSEDLEHRPPSMPTSTTTTTSQKVKKEKFE